LVTRGDGFVVITKSKKNGYNRFHANQVDDRGIDIVPHMRDFKPKKGVYKPEHAMTDINWKDVKDIYMENINEFGKHLDEPREIGKKKVKLSSKEKMMVKNDMLELLAHENTCVNCGNIVDENLKKWFSDKWVNIGKKDKSGKHPACGTSGKKRAYAKCVPASKARSMSKKDKESATRRKRSAQNKANRGGTSSIRGGGKKPIRVKTKAENIMKLEELVGKKLTEAQFDEAAGEKDACYHKVKSRYDVWPSAYASGALVKCRKVGAKNWGNKSKKEGFASDAQRKAAFASGYEEKGKKKKKKENLSKRIDGITKEKEKDVKEFKVWSLDEKCWKGYEKKGMKTMFGKKYPNCVKKEGVQTNVWLGENELYYESNTGEFGGYTFDFNNEDINEAEYQGRKVKLGKPMQGDTKKFKVYVKNPKGNTVKVNFGQGGDAKGGTMRIRKSNPKARKAFRARHNCDSPGPRHKARYWSCRKW